MPKLYPFQKEGVQRIHKMGARVVLADDQGLGKTIQTLNYIKRTPNKRPVIVVCPATMKYTWQNEAYQHYKMEFHVLEGRCPEHVQHLNTKFVVINYELLESWLPVLLAMKPSMLVLDECHYAKNRTAKRTKAARKLSNECKHVIALSGTPITNKPSEYWPVLNMVRPDLFPNFVKFGWAYCRPRHTRWGWVFDGSKDTDKLNKLLTDTCMIRRLKAEVLAELPAKTRKVIPLKLSIGARKKYAEARDDFRKWIRKNNPAKAKRALKAEAVSKLGYLVRLASELKRPILIQWIHEFLQNNPDEKLVLMTMHTETIESLRGAWKDILVINGSVKGRDRTDAVRIFQTNPRHRLLVGNIKAAGIGVTLHASSNLVFLDLPWSPGDLMQAEDRIHRIGQKDRVLIQYLLALGTVEENLMKLLRTKSRVLNNVLNGGSTDTDLSVFNDLFKALAA
ncbi:MAG: hypothetical protein Unbinned3891contig1000_13 [Prokaryotic dsDNA virus sp.]|nr:MAG: hypothetical protein Unbinned3891contig1000_13 [Prokaryotic dsDNA virus sp.]|tara:strand:- start:18401 stop:19753 length:1353 start_codon:yes stop_codon:yes gene_type:complete